VYSNVLSRDKARFHATLAAQASSFHREAIIQSHGGERVGDQAEVGVGTKFFFTCPLLKKRRPKGSDAFGGAEGSSRAGSRVTLAHQKANVRYRLNWLIDGSHFAHSSAARVAAGRTPARPELVSTPVVS